MRAAPPHGPRAVLLGRGAWLVARQAVAGRLAWAVVVLRRHREDRRCADSRENVHQRTVARLSDLTDPLPLAQRLIRCNSVTPADGGSQDALAEALESLGFTVHRLRYGEIENIFARLGDVGPHFCFARHHAVAAAPAVNCFVRPQEE